MPAVQHIFKFAGPPTLPPTGEGHHWVDTTANQTYLSKGVSSLSDWVLVGSGGLPNGGGIGQILIKQSVIDGDALWQNIPGVTDTASTIPWYNASGNLERLPGWSVDPATKSISGSITAHPNNAGGSNLQGFQVEFQPLQNSPNETWGVFNNNILIDNLSAGFDFGTNGSSVYIHNNSLSHQGKSNIGGIAFQYNTFNIGNGTDPFSVKGIGYVFAQGQVNANVTVNGPIQGYGFQVSINAAATIDPATGYTNVFYDFGTFGCVTPGYSSFIATPSIFAIANNSNYNVLTSNPTIPTFIGNAGFNGVSLGGTLGTFGTGGYNGIFINPIISGTVPYFNGIGIFPNIGTVSNYAKMIEIQPTIGATTGCVGLRVDMSNVTGTGILAAQFVGDVQITGNLAFSGALSIGKLSAFASQAIINSGGNPQSIHSLVSNMTLASSTTVALADTIGANTASLITLGDNCVVTTAFLGLAALALPAVVQLGINTTVDLIEGAIFAISMDGGAGAGSTIDTVALCRSTAIPNGITAINKLHGYDFVLPFGDPGTETWGFYTNVDCFNWFKGSLKLGGTAGSTDKVTNSSVAFEIESTTAAFLNARMTTTERNALTAINGMQIYNSTTDKLQVYAGGSWVDLH